MKNSDVKQAALAAAEELGADLSVEESTMDMSMLGGSGLELVVRGQDLDAMNEAAGTLRGHFARNGGRNRYFRGRHHRYAGGAHHGRQDSGHAI